MSNLIDIPAVAHTLGVCNQTVRNAWLDGRIPGVRISKLVRFRPEDIERIAAEGLPPPPHAAALVAEGS